MREEFSNFVAERAQKDSQFMVLSGDHGYALFDRIRAESPDQFLNCGIMEQGMIGFSAGLAHEGFKPLVYGLAAFIPTRVLEQIKLDLCHSKRNVVLVGDGAGLVYSTLGSSHHCGEDLGSLKALPHLSIYSPGDALELRACFQEAFEPSGPTYIRIGKGDRPQVNTQELSSTDPYFTHKTESKKTLLVSTGAFLSVAHSAAKELKVSHLSVIRLTSVEEQLHSILKDYEKVITLEEHYPKGGLSSLVSESFHNTGTRAPFISAMTLESKFAHRCGSHQYALSEHGLSDEEVFQRIQSELR